VKHENEADIKIISVTFQGFLIENCKTKKTHNFGIYDELIQLPYLTGIYNRIDNNPHYFMNKRNYLLSFAGGSWRGLKHENGIPLRDIVINKFNELSEGKSDQYNLYSKLFHCPILAKTHSEEGMLGWNYGIFSVKAKEVYLDSVFSWQPCGDTSTRRGFYEAILLGNIPVISKGSYDIYKKLLVGEESIKNVAIVLDNDKFFDAEYIFETLLSISNDEIIQRRNNISNICNRLQWNINSDENVLSDVIEMVKRE